MENKIFAIECRIKDGIIRRFDNYGDIYPLYSYDWNPIGFLTKETSWLFEEYIMTVFGTRDFGGFAKRGISIHNVRRAYNGFLLMLIRSKYSDAEELFKANVEHIVNRGTYPRDAYIYKAIQSGDFNEVDEELLNVQTED